MKSEDAQCLKTDIVIDPTFYILLTASLTLALLNTFIMKATAQYMDELKNVNIMIYMSKELDIDIGVNDEKLTKENVDVVPIQFTDRFRWVLINNENISQTPMTSVETMMEHESVDSIESNQRNNDDSMNDIEAHNSHEDELRTIGTSDDIMHDISANNNNEEGELHIIGSIGDSVNDISADNNHDGELNSIGSIDDSTNDISADKNHIGERHTIDNIDESTNDISADNKPDGGLHTIDL